MTCSFPRSAWECKRALCAQGRRSVPLHSHAERGNENWMLCSLPRSAWECKRALCAQGRRSVPLHSHAERGNETGYCSTQAGRGNGRSAQRGMVWKRFLRTQVARVDCTWTFGNGPVLAGSRGGVGPFPEWTPERALRPPIPEVGQRDLPKPSRNRPIPDRPVRCQNVRHIHLATTDGQLQWWVAPIPPLK